MPNAQIANALLQRVALFHRMGRLIGEIIAPPWRVDAEKFEYLEWAAEHLAEVDTRWQGGATPSESNFRWKTRTAKTDVHKHRVPLAERDLSKARAVGGMGENRLRQARVRTATGVILTGYEAEVVAAYTDSANYKAGHVLAKAGGAEWDQAAVTDQDVVDDISGRIDLVLDALPGFSAMDLTAVVPERVWRKAIRYNSVLRDAVKSGTIAQVSEDLFKAYFQVGQVLIPTGVKLSGKVNVDKEYETEGLTPHWGDNVWIGIVGNGQTAGVEASEDGLFDDQLLGFAATAVWTGDTQGQRRLVREYEDGDQGKEVSWYEVKEERKVVPTNKLAGALIKNTLSTI